MPDKILVPTADAVITPVLEKIYEKRPTAFPFLNLRGGVYWHPVLGFRAQAALMLQRVALLASERTLKTATGSALLDYVASEYDAVPSLEKTAAIGHITLGRGTGNTNPAGQIPAGTRFTRTKFSAGGVTFETAEFETLVDAFMPINSTAQITIPVVATRVGAHANTPRIVGNTATGITFPKLFDNIAVVDFQSAGGSEGADDEYVRSYAKAYAVGQFGPVGAAARLGALSTAGVRHMLSYDYAPDGSQTILVADSSWASSDRLAAVAQQTMFDEDLVGFGCKVSTTSIRNLAIYVSAVVSLRDANYLSETTAAAAAIQAAVKSYFDDRLDWNVWNDDALRGAITRSHPKIFGCSSVTVTDAITGATLTQITQPDYSTEQYHYIVGANGTKITFVGPS